MDDIGTGELVTAPANAALDSARAELTEIATNPANPRHAGYQRGDKAVSEYLDSLYKKAVPETRPQDAPTNPAPPRDPAQTAPMTPEDRVAQNEVETGLQRAFGEDYDREMQNMRVGASHIFSIPNGEQVLAALSPLITALGPLAEVRTVRYLAELGQLIKNHKGGLL